MGDLSLRIREIIEEIKNPDRFSRKTLEFEILCHEMDIEKKYRQIRKIKARSSIKNMKGNLIKMTEAVSE